MGLSAGERELRSALSSLARRDLAVRAFVGAASGSALGCGLAALVGRPGWILVSACAGALIGAARRSAWGELARRVDAVCDTADAVACAWDYRDADGGMALAQRARALKWVVQVPPSGVVPRPSLAWWASLPLGVATWLALSGPSPQPLGGVGTTRERARESASESNPEVQVAQTMPPSAEPSDIAQVGQGGPAPPTGALRVGASAPGEQPPDAGAPGNDTPGDLPSMARAGIGQQAAELAGERAEVLERSPASDAGGPRETLPITLGAGDGERPRREGRKAGDGPRALLPGDDAWAPPERAHPPRWRAVVARYFAGSESPTSTQGDTDGKRGE